MSTPSIFSAIQTLTALLAPNERWQPIKIMGFSLVSSILELTTAITIILLAQILNMPLMGEKYLRYIGITHNLSPNTIILYSAIFVGITYFIKNSISMVEVFFTHSTIQKLNYRFKKRLLERYSQTNYSAFLTRNSSEGYSVVTSEVDILFSVGVISLAGLFSEGLILIALLGMIIYVEPMLALFVFPVGGIIWLVLSKAIFPKFYAWGKNVQDLTISSNKKLFEFFHAYKEILLLGKRDLFIKTYYDYDRKKSKMQARKNASAVLPRMATELVFIILLVLTIAYFSLNNTPQDKMVGILGGYLYIGFRLMPGLNRIITQLNTLKSCLPSFQKVSYEYLQSTDKITYKDCPEFCFNQSITLKDVSFCYPNASKNTLQNINLKIKKGDCIGIIGETGSGKSTLSDLLLGLLLPESGTILVDNTHSLISKQWHNLIGYVQQSIYLIDDTIRANIAFGIQDKDINENLLQYAIQTAQLDTLISKLPEGVDTNVGERGARLSGGERQRVAIARALYRNPKVLILDEATSALDNKTEEKLIKTIDLVRKQGLTIIMIAHRLTTLKNCDEIIVLKNGTIDRIISYEELSNEQRSPSFHAPHS